MTIQELINVIENNKAKVLSADQLQALLKKHIDVKEYIGIKTKKEIIDSIIDECILYEDGVFKFDEIDKYIYFTMKAIVSYTNIEMSTDIYEEYDLLCKSKLLYPIINTFKKEYDDLNILLQMKCEYIMSNNTLEAQAGRLFENILAKLDGITDSLKDNINNFDFDKLQINDKFLEKVIKLINIQK